MEAITENTRRLLRELPADVLLVVAGKGHAVEELVAATEGCAQVIGENYVQEAERAITALGQRVRWHFIGHLQKNKVKRAIELFDMIETVDSAELAAEIDRRCAQAGKIMPVLIEINSAREPKKSGVMPEEAVELARVISTLPHVRLMGLMTMGPASGEPAACSAAFALTRSVFDQIATLKLTNVEMKCLSMGMTDSYKQAMEAGANIVRIGRGIFGVRP